MSNKVPYYSDELNNQMAAAVNKIFRAQRGLEWVMEGSSSPLFLEGVAEDLADALNLVLAVRRPLIVQADLGFVFNHGYQLSNIEVKRG